MIRNNVMCFGKKSSPALPPAPSGETRTFAYGPKGKKKTPIEIPKTSKASGNYTPYKKTKPKASESGLNISQQV